MRSSVAELIAERIDSMPASERRAAQTLIAAYPLIGLKTVAEFSQQAGVSSPTILRFVARLGFQNYPEFQAALQVELAEQLQSPLLRGAQVKRGEGAPPMVDVTIENIRETFGHLSTRQMREIVDRLSAPRSRIYLVGGRFSDAIASYMSAHLAIMRPHVMHLGGQEGAWFSRLVDMGKRDTLVVFDIRRYQNSLEDFSERAQRRGVAIVLVTDQWLSPIARFARYVIAARTAVPSRWDSSAALFVVAEAIIAEVSQALGQEGEKRIRELDTLRRPED
ncbi:MAG: MurR/RpiR family transcriptional regulator [Rhizobiaceae bacterium]|nr:MurR/RpiR family transcriptional regulator [Rhizobiaceae bacterium]